MNILIVEDHIAFREILENVCSTLFGDIAVTCVGDGRTALHLCQSQAFALLLLDLQLHNIDSFTIADTAARLAPNIRIIALTSHCNDYTVYRAEKNG